MQQERLKLPDELKKSQRLKLQPLGGSESRELQEPAPEPFISKLETKPPPIIPDESTGQMIKNIGKGLKAVPEGLMQILRFAGNVGVRGTQELFKKLKGDPENLVDLAYTPEGIDVIKQGVEDTALEIFNGLVDRYKTYKTDPLRLAYDDPVGVFLDVLTVASLGGTAAGQAAKVAKVVGVPKAAVRLEQAANVLRGFPFSKTPSGKEKLVKPLAQSPVLKTLGKIPGAKAAVQALKLTPGFRETYSLLHRHINSFRRQAEEKDIQNAFKLMEDVPERELSKGLVGTLTGKYTGATIKSAKGTALANAVRARINQETREKIAHGRLNPRQAVLSAVIPLQHQTALRNIGEAVKAGQLSVATARNIVALLKETKKTFAVNRALANLAKEGWITHKDARKLIKFGNTGSYFRNLLAPITDVVNPQLSRKGIPAMRARGYKNNLAQLARPHSVKAELKGKRFPTYLPSIHIKNINVLDQFMPKPLRYERASWMKTRTGANGMITDARALIPIMIQQYRKWQATERFFADFLKLPFVYDVTMAVRNGLWKESRPGHMLISPDHSLFPFFKDANALAEKMFRGIKDAADDFGGDALRAAIKNTLSPDTVAMVAKSAMKRGQNLRFFEVPTDVAQLVAKAIAPPSGLAKAAGFIFESANDLLRASALTLSLPWYIGNLLGNILFTWMGGTSLSSYFRGSRVSSKRIVPKTIYDEVMNAVEGSFHDLEMRGGWRTGRLFTSLPPFRNLLKFNSAIENWARRVAFVDAMTKEAFKRKLITVAESMYAADDVISKRLKPLFDQAMIRKTPGGPVLGITDHGAVAEAVKYVNKWLFDYSNLHPTERFIIRRLVPFWTFIKNINILALRLHLERPLLTQMLGKVPVLMKNRVDHMMITALNDDDLPDWLEGHLPLYFDSRGNPVFMSLRGLNPFTAFTETDLAKPEFLAAAMSPLVKAGIEWVGGREVWSKRDVIDGEPVWDYSGRKLKIRVREGKTWVENETPGPRGIQGLLEQTWNQYPWSKVLRAFMAQKEFNSRGQPTRLPMIDENGNPIYPTPYIHSAMRLAGVNLKEYDPVLFERRKRIAIKNFIRDTVYKMRNAPPELRDFYRHVIQDAAAGNIEIAGY